MVIRTATGSEWTTVADITQSAYDQYASEAIPEFWHNYTINTRQTILTEPAIDRIVLTAADEIVATVIYCPPYEKQIGDQVIKNPYPEMRLLAVLPQHRNKGCGDLLITECERRARSEGYECISLHTTGLMTVAKAMYQRRGYSRFEQIDFEPVHGFHVWGFIKRITE